MTVLLSRLSALLAASVLLLILMLVLLQAGRALKDAYVKRARPRWEDQLVAYITDSKEGGEVPPSFRRLWVRPFVFEVMMEVVQKLEGSAKARCANFFEALGEVQREIRRLESPRTFSRARAAYRLGGMGHSKAVRPLMDVLADGSVEVRFAAVQALGELGAREAILPILRHADQFEPYHLPAVVHAMKRLNLGEHPEGRAYVAEIMLMDDGLCRLGIALVGAVQVFEALPLFWSNFERMEESLRVAAAQAIGELGDPRSADPLCFFLHDPFPEVRRAVLETLGKLQNPNAIPWILPLMKDARWEVSEAAVQAVAQLDPSGASLTMLLEKEGEEDVVRFKAAMALESLGVVDRWTQELKTATGEALQQVRRRLRLAAKYEADQPIVKRVWHAPTSN